jgi:UPF0755 protein
VRERAPSIAEPELVLATVVAAAIAALTWLFLVYPADVRGTGRGAQELTLVVEGDDGIDEVAAGLEHLGAIDDARLFALYARLLGADERLRRGPVRLRADMSIRTLLARVAEGLGPTQIAVLVPEGFDRFEIAARLARWDVCDEAAFLEATEDRALLDELEITGPSAEGYLLPDTYTFATGSDPRDVVRRFVRAYRAATDDLFEGSGETRARLERLHLGPHEVLVLASIVEQEAVAREEQPVIAGVFVNRLESETFLPRHRLQADPTISYGCKVEPTRPSCEASMVAASRERCSRTRRTRTTRTGARACLPRRSATRACPRSARCSSTRDTITSTSSRAAAADTSSARRSTRTTRAWPTCAIASARRRGPRDRARAVAMPRRKEPVGTLSLFDRDEPTRDPSATLPEAPAAASLRGSLLAPVPAPRAEDIALAARVPPHVHMGTSSWTFAGWADFVYRRHYPSQKEFVRSSLEEYVAHPLLRTVGIDRSYYGPLPREELASYAALLPEGYRVVMKVWDEIAALSYPDHARFGARAGQPNPRFLDVGAFAEHVALPVEETFRSHLAAYVIEIPPTPHAPDVARFEAQLDRFLVEGSAVRPLLGRGARLAPDDRSLPRDPLGARGEPLLLVLDAHAEHRQAARARRAHAGRAGRARAGGGRAADAPARQELREAEGGVRALRSRGGPAARHARRRRRAGRRLRRGGPPALRGGEQQGRRLGPEDHRGPREALRAAHTRGPWGGAVAELRTPRPLAERGAPPRGPADASNGHARAVGWGRSGAQDAASACGAKRPAPRPGRFEQGGSPSEQG